MHMPFPLPSVSQDLTSINSRSAAELDELFDRKIRPWNFSKTVTATQMLVENEKSGISKE